MSEARLIDADALRGQAEPVRHGRWTVDDMGYTHCSWCGKRISYFHRPETKDCPHCGAKMDGGTKDG